MNLRHIHHEQGRDDRKRAAKRQAKKDKRKRRQEDRERFLQKVEAEGGREAFERRNRTTQEPGINWAPDNVAINPTGNYRIR